ncbi:hypothetical protein ACT3CD_11085 [Geofilum sp. OHC36d9]|uniref:hypothetical protein n=1 Tax=Geofilum sp. OHC36d9 TaxID=3458413 RepID=UPI004033CA0F
MNKTQTNQFRMFLSTQSFLDSNASTWSSIPRIVTYKNGFDEIISRIQSKNESSHLNVGVTQQKGQLKETIAAKTSMLSGILQIIASEQGDEDLVNAVKITRSEIIKLRESDLSATVKNITVKAEENIEALAEFGVTPEVITGINASVDDYNALIGEPRTILSQKYAALSNIEELFDEGNSILKLKLDNSMLLFRENQEEFYQGYLNARTIVDN